MIREVRNTLAVMLVLSGLAAAQMMPREPQLATPPPKLLNDVSIEQKLDSQLPLDATFKDENGRDVKLGDYFGKKPVVLALVYYECPMLCTEVLNGMTASLRLLKFDVGKEFNVVTISFDPKETPKLALAKKKAYVQRYDRPGADQGWHFLTGPQTSIAAVTNAVGFHYAWDNNSQQFAHATAIFVITPQGKVAQYFYGVEYSPRDLRLGLIQASQNKIGTLVDQVLLYCYHYDPRSGKYGAIVSRIISIAGAVTVVFLGGFLILMFRLEPKSVKTKYTAGERNA